MFLQANDQLKRYDCLTNQCRSVSAPVDLNSLVKILQPESPPKVPKKSYVAPAPGDIEEVNFCFAMKVWPIFIHLYSIYLHELPPTVVSSCTWDICKTYTMHEQHQDQSPIPFRNELIVERNASLQVRPSIDALKRETIEIESQIRQLQVKVIPNISISYNKFPP